MQRITYIHNHLTTTTQDAPPTTIKKQGEIGIITLYNPKTFNALVPEMRASLVTSLKTLSEDPEVKVVCLCSTHPKVFCAGANIKEFENDTTETFLNRDTFQELDLVLRFYNKPILCAVNSLALGGGFEIALHSDVIIAAEGTQFGLPEIKLGLFPGIGGTLISKTIGK